MSLISTIPFFNQFNQFYQQRKFYFIIFPYFYNSKSIKIKSLSLTFKKIQLENRKRTKLKRLCFPTTLNLILPLFSISNELNKRLMALFSISKQIGSISLTKNNVS